MQLLPKGTTVGGEFVTQFPNGHTAFSQSYRAKDKNGNVVRLELVNLSKSPASCFDEQGNLNQVFLLSTVDHSNLPKLIKSGRVLLDGQPTAFLVYEFISGEFLTDKLKREGIFSPFSAVPLLIDLLGAIDYLHSLPVPIVHNNIIPDSILLDYSGNQETPVLLNFEHARTLSASPQRLAVEHLTPFYTAPEVLNGVFSLQSDLYSAGALLYQLLVGLPPWYDEKLVGQPLNKVRHSLEALRKRPLHFEPADDFFDEHLQNIIIKALSPDVSNRFQCSSDFIKALKREVIIEKKDLGKAPPVDANSRERKIGTGFDQIAGMAALKETLYNDVIRALHEKELYASYGVTIPNGMLLYGPPGCGKTFIAQKFAEEVGFNFVMIKPSDVQSKYINATQENIGKLFKEAEEKAPTILFFDELDALVPSREGDLHHMHASAVNEFLAQMTNCGDKGIFVIGATNRPEKIDTAILRTGRLDKVVYLPPPDLAARKAMFELYLKNRPVDLGINYDALAASAENMVSSDIKFLIDETARKALKARSRITMQVFEEVLRDTKPSVSLAEIRKYEVLRQKLESEDR